MSRRWTPEEIDSALTAYILLGSAEKAAQACRDADLPVPARTLTGWLRKHASRLQELERDIAPQVAERIAARSERIALLAVETEEKLLQKVNEGVERMKPEAAAQALKNVTTSKALQFDRIAGPVRGRPNVVVQRLDSDAVMRQLANRLGFAIDSTAVEIPPKELTP